jgi:hypothetical protein
MTERTGDWIQTYTGGQFWPLDPRAAEINVIDVAAGLAKECRYGGQCLRFFSVAEHSELMRRAAVELGASPRMQRAVLFHDASEGLGLRDIPRPIKSSIGNYKDIEARVMAAVAARFDFDWPMPPMVKLLDESIGLSEEAQNMAPPPIAWRENNHAKFSARDALDVRLKFWLPDQAFAEFLRGYAACAGGTR